MRGRRTGSRQGLSLLEVLFTISLLTIVLVAFAAVYPSGYKLNRKSAKATVAVETASAVAAELQGLPFQDQRPNVPTLTLLASAPANVQTFIQSQMRTYIPDGFKINNDCIQVAIEPSSITSDPTPQIAYITVTVYWQDNNNNVERNISVVTSKTANQAGR